MSALPDPVTALLQAVIEAIDLPLAGAIEDHDARALLLDLRAGDACVILAAALRGDNVADCAEQLREWTANRPVTYTVWVPEQDGGQPS
jgi:hypothetical protein